MFSTKEYDKIQVLYILTLITPGKSTSTILCSPGPFTFKDMVYSGDKTKQKILGGKFVRNSLVIYSLKSLYLNHSDIVLRKMLFFF